MSTLKNFRSYELSIQFYQACKPVMLPYALKDQLTRAASSITLNLAEGAAKPSSKERLRYYSIAFGSSTSRNSTRWPINSQRCSTSSRTNTDA